MRTEKQIAAARINGAKSRGPRTDAGKRRSSQNARRHGLCAANTVVEGELAHSFEELKAETFADFAPTSAREIHLANIATQALWRLRRIWEIERAEFDEAIAKQPEGLPAKRAAAAFREMGDHSRILDLLHRYDTRLERQYHRAIFQLERQRDFRRRSLAPFNGDDPLAHAAAAPNEPQKQLKTNATASEAIPSEPSRNPSEPGPNPPNPETNPAIHPSA